MAALLAASLIRPDAHHFVEAYIPGRPMPCPRPRVYRGRATMPKRYQAYRNALAWDLKAAHDDRPIVGNVGLALAFVIVGGRIGDLDNYAKTVLDAGNGVVWEDDAQVVEIHAAIHRSGDDPCERTEVVVYR